MPKERRRSLLGGLGYEQIISEIAASAQLLTYRRERCRTDHKYFRLNATLGCCSRHVDLFHNSSAGYRAQYLLSIPEGERANCYAVSQIGGRVCPLIRSSLKRTCPDAWVKATVEDSAAKIWIHQGRWLRGQARADRMLSVERWREDCAPDADTKKKARWSQLTPEFEDRIDLKGGFVTMEGESLGSLKPARSKNINRHGFT
jgi:hypothetical protein